MPAILGGLVAGLAALGQDPSYLFYSTGRLQLGWQVVAMVVTLLIGITGGLFVGWLLSIPFPAPELTTPELFDDGVWWAGITVEELGDEDYQVGNSKWAREAPEMVNSVFNVGKASVAYNAHVYGGSKAGSVHEFEAATLLQQAGRAPSREESAKMSRAMSRDESYGKFPQGLNVQDHPIPGVIASQSNLKRLA